MFGVYGWHRGICVYLVEDDGGIFFAFCRGLGFGFLFRFRTCSVCRLRLGKSLFVWGCPGAAGEVKGLVLTEKVSFQAMLQRGNRLQVPRVVRWHFKLESDQVLKVTVSCREMCLIGQQFYTTMSKDGRIGVPKLILSVLARYKPSLEGYAIQVTLEPS